MNRTTRSLCSLTLVALLAILLGGCAKDAAQSTNARNGVGLYNIGDYAQAAATFKPESQKKDENFVLNNCRLGSAALAAGQTEEAENAFMNVYEVVNGVKTNDTGRTLGATVVFEGIKVWKGEPFERAMAHYYLGVTFLMKNDYENARSAFQNSLFKLREYAKESKEKKEGNPADEYKQFESNFALGYFGLAFSYQRLNKSELAEANYKLALEKDPRLADLIAAVQKPGVNTLLFVDAFTGPQKSPKGWYNEESAFGPTPAEAGELPPVSVTLNGQPLTAETQRYALVDTLAMAQDQQWQDIDTIRKTKAVIGTGTMAAGGAMMGYGAARGDPRIALAGLGVTALGALISASSQADLRYWETLPRTVYCIPATLAPGESEIAVTLPGASNSATLKITPKPSGDNVLYFRLR